MLGNILGETIRRFEGEAVFQYVEAFRGLFKRIHRQKDESARAELADLIEQLMMRRRRK